MAEGCICAAMSPTIFTDHPDRILIHLKGLEGKEENLLIPCGGALGSSMGFLWVK